MIPFSSGNSTGREEENNVEDMAPHTLATDFRVSFGYRNDLTKDVMIVHNIIRYSSEYNT